MPLSYLGDGIYVPQATSALTWEAPSGPFDFYIFIDPDDGNKYKAKNCRTGNIDYVDSTNADTVINGAISTLSAGSTQNTVVPNLNLWTGGHYGTILIGPGTYSVSNSIIMQSNLAIIGSSPWNTRIKLIPQHADNSNSTVFKSSTWDSLSFPNTPTSFTGQHGDKGVTLANMAIDGNRVNNQNTITTTQSTTISGGVEQTSLSWGHGVAFRGFGLTLDNCWILTCRGAGVVAENMGTNLGGVTGTSPTAFEIRAGFRGMTIHNCVIADNDQQGVIVRTDASIRGIHSIANGEIGIDVQSSQYFSGSLWNLTDGIMFLDCKNHINDDMSVFNARLVELRICSAFDMHVHDIWIEGPYGPGTCISLGLETNPVNPTGNTLGGSLSFTHLDNIIVDNIHWYALYVGKDCYRNRFTNIKIKGTNEVSTSAFQNGIQMNGRYGNVLEAQVFYLPSPGDLTNHHPALIMGDGSNIPFLNFIKLQTFACQYDLKWGNASNYGNDIEIIHSTNLDTPASIALLDPSGAAIDYTKNNIRVSAIGSTPSDYAGYMGSNGGTATTTGTTNPFLIAHGLFAAPAVYLVEPTNSSAAGINYYLTVDSTNVKVNFTTTPSSGMSFVWSARVNNQ